MKYTALLLFITLIIILQLNSYLLLGVWTLLSIMLYFTKLKPVKDFIVTSLLFGIGFGLYLYISAHWIEQIDSKIGYVFYSRLSLALILIPLFAQSFLQKSSFILFWKKPLWNEKIVAPFIWFGPHLIRVRWFLLIALTINIVSFVPFIGMRGWDFVQGVLLLAAVFSLVNGVLEELIWRGAILSRFLEQFGEKWAVLLTSLGFGLQHYSLGFSWIVCAAFAAGGFFYGAITIKSKSILPAIIWHVTLNILMVFSGLILN
ncbi:lysostaphin resistance A-like protein [Fictibacillus aquaticus]|uniref:CAAX prenyl protease 2/Lysostaphin resistance protein A-like domain-containing protein n=1 Tax=Fictibacillus aquaticus TaxID=2021314 RepID=A0A235F5Z4_9BACL|nr:type II CAAX endopeptidase family protein [Fictibacillus aquaticus]OYD56701.1 hypothetical protein CGZ90_16975 [Fictibacillus aquaticus]